MEYKKNYEARMDITPVNNFLLGLCSCSLSTLCGCFHVYVFHCVQHRQRQQDCQCLHWLMFLSE